MVYGKVYNREETIKICVVVEHMLKNLSILGSIIIKIGRNYVTSYNFRISTLILKVEMKRCKFHNC